LASRGLISVELHIFGVVAMNHVSKSLHFLLVVFFEATLFLGSPSLALRSEDAVETIEQWAEKARAKGNEGKVAAELVLNIETGVQKTTTLASYTDSEGSLALEVVHSQPNEGEIATPSKLPLLWVLESRITYTLVYEDTWKLVVNGIKLLPVSEGLEMYQTSKCEEACKSKAELADKTKCERKAFFKWYKKNFDKTLKTQAYCDYAKNPSHKLGRMLKSLYGDWTTWYSIKSQGSGDEAWQKFLYNLITIPPVKLDFFTFQATSSDYGEVEMAMAASPVIEGTYGNLNLAAYEGMSFYEKNAAEFDPVEFEKQRAKGFSPTIMNFGAMTAKGRNLQDQQVRGGTAKYILKTTSPCTNPADPPEDPTFGCQNNEGRLFWH